jgi:hypothetical protein
MGENVFAPGCRNVNSDATCDHSVHSSRTVVRMEDEVSRRIEDQSGNLKDRSPYFFGLIRKPPALKDAALSLAPLDVLYAREL